MLPIGSEGPLGRLLLQGEYGHDFIDELRPWPGELVVDKPGYSAFKHTELQPWLQARGIDTLVRTGVTTEVCVSSTLRSTVDRGYRCITVRDACASSYADLHAAMLATIGVEDGIFGRVMDNAAVVAALA